MLTFNQKMETGIHLLIWFSGILYFILKGSLFFYPYWDGGNYLYYVLPHGTLLNIILFYGLSLYILPRCFSNKQWLKLALQLFVFFMACHLLESWIDEYFLKLYFEDGYCQTNLIDHVFNPNARVSSAFVILAFTYYLGKDWIRNDRLKKHLREENLKAELAFLRSQIHPHFLFNTLNNLFALALDNKGKETAEGIAKLSKLMRYLIYESNVKSIPLEKEVAYLQTYISLQKMRIMPEDDIVIEFRVEGNIRNIGIAPMLLIPYVENAFKHGISLQNNSWIDISLRALKNQIIFKIENTNQRQKPTIPDKASGLGLKNVKRRLQLLYPGQHDLIIQQNPDIFSVQLTIDI